MAIKQRNDSAESLIQTAVLHHLDGRLTMAEGLYRKALRRAPHDAETHYNHGVVLLQLGRTDDAIAAWRAAVRHRPDYGKALTNLGGALAERDRWTEADTVLRKALLCGTGTAETHNNLAIALWGQDDPAAALDQAKRALVLQPGYADGLNTVGVIFQRTARMAESALFCRRAIAVQPVLAKAHFNLALALLALGRYAEGWREHAWRWRGGSRHLAQRRFTAPAWQGDAPGSRTILLYGEQGLGDSLQFVRYATILARQGARVILEVAAPLVRLFAGVQGVAAVCPAGDPLPPFDAHLPLMSMAEFVDGIPADTPYLRADPEATAVWHHRLAALPGLKVGLVWSGDPRPHDARAQSIDRRRSIPLQHWLPILRLRGPAVSFLSLQKGRAARQLSDLPPALRPIDYTAELDDFADTAALTSQLDLVISVDTSVAHLAGALGKPVWILSRFDACWRWLQDRDDTPWYPTARLFRQATPGDWAPVIARVSRELVGFIQ